MRRIRPTSQRGEVPREIGDVGGPTEVLAVYRWQSSDRAGFMTGSFYCHRDGQWRRGGVYMDDTYTRAVLFSNGVMACLDRRVAVEQLRLMGLREVA